MISTSKKSLNEEKPIEAQVVTQPVHSETPKESIAPLAMPETPQTAENIVDAVVTSDIDATLIQPLPTFDLQVGNLEASHKNTKEEETKLINSKLSKDDELC